jgi:nicotinate-nucleotide adenylyltransferase
MKIGLLGGTFNPVHLGHVKMSRKIAEMKCLDKMIFIPSYIPPHKQDEEIPSPEKRIEMLKLALEEENDFAIDGYEVRKKGISYSIDTIRYLKKKYPEDELFWIIGADMLFQIEKWHDFKNVLREMSFITVKREGYDKRDIEAYIAELRQEYSANIAYCEMDPIDISSTDIRGRVKHGKGIKKLVHKKVEQYIIDNNLYK